MAESFRTHPDSELVFLPLGGSGEIGMNLNLYGFGPPEARHWIMVDLGVTFGDERTPGIDLIMPDPGYILEEARGRLLGLVLTHGHEDHIGAVGHLWPHLRCPIFATPFTAELVRAKLEETGYDDEAEITEIPLSGRLALGPFEIELITLTHSIPEPNALVLRTPLGTVLHTGDWKIDPSPLVGEVTDDAALRAIGDEGVLAMVCDSTNVFVPGESGSEEAVRDSLHALIGTLPGKVVVTCFASNIARLETIMKVAAAQERHVCLVGRSMHRMVAAAQAVGLLCDVPGPLSDEEAGYLPPEHVLYLCTGSQGEPRAALTRIVQGRHPHISLGPGDAVIFSSRIIPGNEVAIYELQNRLAEMGVRIITEKDHFVHVSGHPCRDELAKMYQWVRPRLAVPVHGEARHLLEHAELAQELQVPATVVPHNGSLVRLAPGEGEIIDEVPSGRLYLDGQILVPEGISHLRERRKMSFAGHVVVALVMTERGTHKGGGRLLAPPQICLTGIPERPHPGGESLQDVLEEAVGAAVDSLPAKFSVLDDHLEQAARRSVRRVLDALWGKKPLVDVSVIWV